MITLPERRLPWPTPWAEIFGRDAPLLVEIGFGGGHFLVDLARKRPSANIIGVEISLPSLRRGERKIVHAGLPNARLLQCSARYLLWALCAPASVAEVYINFPDPWPKAAHHQRRLINESFLHLLATRMEANGRLDIATDHADYAEWITEALAQTPYFESRLPVPFVTEDNERLRTKYENIALAAGRACHYYKWRRNETLAPDIFPPPEELPMPHVILETPLSLPEIESHFTSFHVSTDDVHLRFMEMFLARDEVSLLVDTYLKEEPVPQRVGLQIRRRPSGDLVVGLHELGFPRPTSGIHTAVRHLADWAVSLHPAGRIVRHNLQGGVQQMEAETDLLD
ncbi:MAG TPA: tRNA (guanosine(46)-N7)-methyltransferase TrmB [Anaerolineae bacterium]|nr:tRNA (guanosine(46)-N7)-methyltransferase TrmB [Anaerolineae bacterium]